MSLKRARPTRHAVKRIYQRTDFPKKSLKQLIVNARKNGKSINDPKFSPEFKEFLKNKQNIRNKIIKVYLGYIWVFSRNSTGLITMYQIPKKFLKKD